ncbi:MAG: hypothetical protein K2M75_05990 [Clostridia bacterium]|nr:hypothetical protein [Clostridia bacterium]
MFKSQIIQLYRGYDIDKALINKEHKEENENLERIRKAVLEKIGRNAQLKDLFLKFEKLLCELDFAEVEDVYKEGFVMGARLALEICGVQCEE